jgi:hypothetical protein
LEEENYNLQENIGKNLADFKDILKELEGMRSDVKKKDEALRNLESEIRLRPNLPQMNAKKVQIEHLTQELE